MERKGRKVPQEFQITLTEQQKQDRRKKAAELDLERDAKVQELAKETEAWKLRKGELKKPITDLEAERIKLNREAESGQATITDDCLAVQNFEACTMEYYYPFKPKKGEEQVLVKTRTLDPDERQRSMLEEQAGNASESGQEVEAEE